MFHYKSKKHKLLPPLIVILFLFLVGVNYAAKIKLRVNVSLANIRLDPTTKSRIILTAPLGSILISEEKEGNWYKILFPPSEGKEIAHGYIHQSIVEVLEEIQEAPIKKKVVEKKTVETKKVRKGEEEKKPEGISWILSREVKKREGKEKKQIHTRESGLSGKGIKFGLNFSGFHCKGATNIETKSSFCVGGFFTYSINKIFKLQPEVMFTLKGGKYDEYFILNLSYLELPLLMKLQLPTESTIKPSILVGPYFSIKLSGKKKIKSEGKTIWENDIENLKGYDFGFVLGGEINIALSKETKILLDVRYAHGLINVFGGHKNKNISCILGVSF